MILFVVKTESRYREESLLSWSAPVSIYDFNFGFKVTIKYTYIDKETGLAPGTTDQAGQDGFNAQKAKVENQRTDVYNGLKKVNWVQYNADTGLQLPDNNVDNFNLGHAEAYCSENGAVVKKCSQADINCFLPPCKCNGDSGAVTRCSK